MTSLQGSLPLSGSAVWRSDRSTAVFSRDSGQKEESRVRHVVIRDASIRHYPDSHVVYKIEVLTLTNHWQLWRRYSEFFALQQKLFKLYAVPNDLLPPKKYSGNFTASFIESRREGLENYLQRLVNGDKRVAGCAELCNFLDVYNHDVGRVMRKLAQLLYRTGDMLLDRNEMISFTPDQLYCISKQLKMPMEDPIGKECDPCFDLGHVYSFVYSLIQLRVASSRRSVSQSCMKFDLSSFRSLTHLKVDGIDFGLIDNLSSIQAQLVDIGVHHCITSMKDVLIVAVTEQRTMSPSRMSLTDSWRISANSRFLSGRHVVQPWVGLTNLDMSRNSIATLDSQSLDLLPSLTQLNLSYNEFENFDFDQLTLPALLKFNISHNKLSLLSPSQLPIRHLLELNISNNKLHKLTGLEFFVNLRFLDVRYNYLASFKEIDCLVRLKHLNELNLIGNPLAMKPNYRLSVLLKFAAKRSELILDGQRMSHTEWSQLKEFFPAIAARQQSSSLPPNSDLATTLDKDGSEVASSSSIPGTPASFSSTLPVPMPTPQENGRTALGANVSVSPSKLASALASLDVTTPQK